MFPCPELCPDHLSSCVQRALILHRLLHRCKVKERPSFPVMLILSRTQSQLSQQSRPTHTFWTCPVGPDVPGISSDPWLLVGSVLLTMYVTRFICMAHAWAIICLEMVDGTTCPSWHEGLGMEIE